MGPIFLLASMVQSSFLCSAAKAFVFAHHFAATKIEPV
jgi:hypothetical protein